MSENTPETNEAMRQRVRDAERQSDHMTAPDDWDGDPEPIKLTEQQQQIRKLLAEAGDIPSADVESYELDFALQELPWTGEDAGGWSHVDQARWVFECEWDESIKKWFSPEGPNA
jgi:hypothetical protein